MKKIALLMMITATLLLTGCVTNCCSDGRGHCCPAKDRTCPFRGYNAWWY